MLHKEWQVVNKRLATTSNQNSIRTVGPEYKSYNCIDIQLFFLYCANLLGSLLYFSSSFVLLTESLLSSLNIKLINCSQSSMLYALAGENHISSSSTGANVIPMNRDQEKDI